MILKHIEYEVETYTMDYRGIVSVGFLSAGRDVRRSYACGIQERND